MLTLLNFNLTENFILVVKSLFNNIKFKAKNFSFLKEIYGKIKIMSTHLFVKNLPLSLEKLQLSSPNVVTHNSAATGFIKDKSVIIIIVYVKLSEVVG